mgnify:CR=1 FL=1|jgi:phosphatidylglycerol---prolipoprotein diacylglyceryl transferase
MIRPGWYQAFLFFGAVLSFAMILRMTNRDRRLAWIYLGGFIGAFAGAKLAFFVVDGWSAWDSPQPWQALITGKSILGALPGGYVGVEIAKKLTGYDKPTGDYFALVAPLGILIGRVGCLLHGCCPGRIFDQPGFSIPDIHGVLRWPAVPVEMAFNLVAFFVFLWMRRTHRLPGQHFHIYMMAYGIFRMLHEPLRETVRLNTYVTGYGLVACAVFTFGLFGFLRRQQSIIAN